MRHTPQTVARHLGTTAIAAATVMAVTPTVYLAVLTVAGLRTQRPLGFGRPSTRFTLLVPAHDEQTGIGETLTSFRAIEYPDALFDVHVVADNCTDDTAAVVRTHGWNVHERREPHDPGKGPALNWLLGRLLESDESFDAVVIVDADTTLDPEFLRAMDREFQRGVDAAQGFYTVRDPAASPAASFRFAALACRHHLRAQGRCRLGGSCGLYGNGMAFRRDLLAERSWSGHLVEDAEFQNELLLDGRKVRYVPDAVVRAEMPSTTAAARTQNERWERGRLLLARRFVPLHVRHLVRGPHRIAHADAALDHLVPPISALLGWQLCTAVMSVIATRRSGSAPWITINLTAVAMLLGHAIAGLASIRAARNHYTALLGAPKMMMWKIGIMANVFRPSTDVEWIRTRRNEEAPS